jgi:hypothetical protein
MAEVKLGTSDGSSSRESKRGSGDDSSICSEVNLHPAPRLTTEAERPVLDTTRAKVVSSLVHMGYIEAAAHAALRATMADVKPGDLSEQSQVDMALEWLQSQAEAAARSKLRPTATTFEVGLASCLPPEAAMALMARETCSCPSSSHSSSPTPPGTVASDFAYLDAATGYMYMEPPNSPPPPLYLDPMSDPAYSDPAYSDPSYSDPSLLMGPSLPMADPSLGHIYLDLYNC